VEEIEAIEARGAGEAIEVGDAVEARVLERAVGEVDHVEARGIGEAIEVADAVDAEEVTRAVELIEYMDAAVVGGAVVALVVISASVGVVYSNIASASAADIVLVNQSLSLPWSNSHGSSRMRLSFVIAFLQSRFRSPHSNISVLSYSMIMPPSVTALLICS
jgi:hypothetical protein